MHKIIDVEHKITGVEQVLMSCWQYYEWDNTPKYELDDDIKLHTEIYPMLINTIDCSTL